MMKKQKLESVRLRQSRLKCSNENDVTNDDEAILTTERVEVRSQLYVTSASPLFSYAAGGYAVIGIKNTEYNVKILEEYFSKFHNLTHLNNLAQPSVGRVRK